MSETTLYNPASLREEDLIANFVVRTKTFEVLFDDLQSTELEAIKRHFLIQGQRGMGKTTLLLRLKYEMERTESIANWAIPVFFNEETYDVNSLSSFWEKLLKYLDEHFETDGEYYDATEQFVDYPDYEELCFRFLIEKLHARSKKLVIFFDNFGELFLDNLRDKEKKRFREILAHCNEIRIVAASAVVVNDVDENSQPFFNLFQTIHLEGLNKSETYELISKLQEDCHIERRIDIKKHKGKIDTLTVLTGGVIRTIMMLYQVLLDDPNGKALEDLEKVLDKVTPLYKHRIEDLPLQQRRIVDVIAKKWDAVSAKQVASEIREDGRKVQTKLISAQLAQLERNNVVEKKSTTTKNHLYQLRERFFNIWYLMRNGDRRDRKRVAWLTKFLEVWYDDDDGFDTFIRNHIQSLRSGSYIPSSALLIAEALVNSDKIDPKKLEGIIEETSAILKNGEGMHLPDLFNNKKMAVAKRKFDAGEVSQAIEVLNSIKNPVNFTYLLLAYYYFMNSRHKQASEVINKVTSINFDEFNFFKALCMQLGEHELLFKKIDEIEELSLPERRFIQGEIYLKQEQYELAQAAILDGIPTGNFEVKLAIIQLIKRVGDQEGIVANVRSRHENSEIKSSDVVELFILIQDYFGADREINLFAFDLLKGMERTARVSCWLALVKQNMPSVADEIEEGQTLVEEIIEDFETAMFLFEERNDLKSRYYDKSLTNLLIYYILITYEKEKANAVYQKLIKVDPINKWPPYEIAIAVWNEIYDEVFDKLLSSSLLDVEDGNVSILSHILLMLLAKKQYAIVLRVFQHEVALESTLKPIYYALMSLLEKEMPNEIVKMGGELKQPVEEILQKIKQFAFNYQ